MNKKKILILDAGTVYKPMNTTGWLNHHNRDLALKTLSDLGHECTTTMIDSDWDIDEEVEKIKKTDVIIVQTPIWWMAPPWTMKKYEDQVMSVNGVDGTDGRHRLTPEDGYGTGGILTKKYFMLSTTWNAPKGAFRPGDFFDGRDEDNVQISIVKVFEFLGMHPLPSYMYNDVLKNPDLVSNDANWVA
ncbi:MAG: NAD(P)H-dependent oxidoreductase, partial [Burkholderiales bacterium]|nr:NAD(P)H-dependent oxidoreductase [Burkholderiales bacterium]